MTMRWLACSSGTAHILGPCPECHDIQGGLLFGTVSTNYKGRVHTICIDCEKTVDYYTDAKEEKLWKLESVETKGSPSPSPQGKAKKSEKLDIDIEEEAKTEEPVLV